VGKNSILVTGSLELPMRSIACCGVATSPERNPLSASSAWRGPPAAVLLISDANSVSLKPF